MPVILALSLLAGACVQSPPISGSGFVAAPACATGEATIAFDFEGASQSQCVIEGERAFRIVIGPEHAPPINPSPWYAFRYTAKPGADIAIALDYLVGKHRYPPKVAVDDGMATPAFEAQEDGKTARFSVPAGSGFVSAQEVFGGERYDAFHDRIAASDHVDRIDLGQSLSGDPIVGLRMGKPEARNLIVLLGRAHPPEVSGAVAMEAFVDELALLYDKGAIDPDIYQVLAVPLLNPDGVKHGHWRTNRGGMDLNRDWGSFSQPETRAVQDWLEALPVSVRPIVMIDFHSTRSNLFYVQGREETDRIQESFLGNWLVPHQGAIEGYPFEIERRNANPGSGTSKNWFHERYGIPAYTYEVGDEIDRAKAALAARIFARSLVPAVEMVRVEGQR